MVGNKKTSHVQFYTEVMDTHQTLDAGRRSMYDPDEIEEEQRERDARNKACFLGMWGVGLRGDIVWPCVGYDLSQDLHTS